MGSSNKSACKTRRFKASHVIRAAAAVMLAAFAIITQTGCGDKELSKTDFALNTSCTITIYGMSGSEGEAVLDDAFKEIRRYENMLSRTVEGSDVYNINNAGGQPVEVSDDTIAVLKLGIEMGDISDGRFDITVGRLTDLWDFTGDDPHVPEQAAIDEAVKSVSYRNIDIEGNTVRLADPGAAVDLGGVAKGYIADKLREYLSENGVDSALINLGGNVLTLGGKPGGSNFTIGVQKPFGQNSDILGACRLKGMSVVTSGIYERYFVEDDRLYHHILDTKTGYPVENELYSVTIISPTSTDGDALSTICFALGSEDGMALIETLDGIECVYCLSDGTLLFSSGARKFWLNPDEL